MESILYIDLYVASAVVFLMDYAVVKLFYNNVIAAKEFAHAEQRLNYSRYEICPPLYHERYQRF